MTVLNASPVIASAAEEVLLKQRIRHPVPGSVDWVSVCPLDWIVPASGVAAMIRDEQVAIFRTDTDQLFALANLDPFSNAQVLSRGLIGDVDGIPCVFSPMYKHPFSLETGTCPSDPSVSVTAYPVRIVSEIIFVGAWLRRSGGV